MNTVLVVDDMAIYREPICAVLERAGFVARAAESGRQATRMAVEERPNLILLDISMPVMGGLEVLRTLKQDPRTASIPVIMLSEMCDRESVLSASKLGASGYLLKSQFSSAELLKRIRQQLAQSRTAVQAGECADKHATESEPDAQSLQVRPCSAKRKQVGASSPAAAAPEGNDAAASAIEISISKGEVLKRVREEVELRAVPAVLQHVISLTSGGSASFEEVAQVLRHDPALAVKVLRVANSSLFGTGKRVVKVADAAQRIGMAGVRNAVGAITAIENFGRASSGGIVVQRFWEHSLAVGLLAESLGRATNQKNCEHLFLAGLFHDLGRLILGSLYPEAYQSLLRSVAETGAELSRVERQAFGLSHCDVTREVLNLWGSPTELVNAASLHEGGVQQMVAGRSGDNGPLLVSLANRLAHAAVIGCSGDERILPIEEFVQALDLNDAAIERIVEEAVSKSQDTHLFFASFGPDVMAHSYASELASQLGEQAQVAVFCPARGSHPVSIFLSQLGCVSSADPRVAVVIAKVRSDMAQGLAELKQVEAVLKRDLPVLLIPGCGKRVDASDALTGRAPAEIVELPCGYSEILSAVGELTAANAVA